MLVNEHPKSERNKEIEQKIQFRKKSNVPQVLGLPPLLHHGLAHFLYSPILLGDRIKERGLFLC